MITDEIIKNMAVRLHSRMEQMGLAPDGDWASLSEDEKEAYTSCTEWLLVGDAPLGDWQPIETAPESTPILVLAPKAHRGLDSAEVVVLYRMDGETHYWTNGGANSGGDMCFEEGKEPTHWMHLPHPVAFGK